MLRKVDEHKGNEYSKTRNDKVTKKKQLKQHLTWWRVGD